MALVEVRPFAVPLDVHFVATNLRAEDKRELETATGRTGCEAVFAAWATSDLTYVAHVDGLPAVVFGVAQGGVIWLVGTDAISRAPLGILRLARRIVPAFLDTYGVLHNVADIRNSLHLRWLKLLGFTFGPLVDVRGQPFRQFQMKKEATLDV